ncbi:unnamed protein product [Parnassius mnemosyne]
MSRIESISLEEDYIALSVSQEGDPELKKHEKNSSLRLEKVTIPGTSVTVICDTSTGRPRPFRTHPFRRAAFNKLHNLSHPGVRATVKLVSERYVWPDMKKECRVWARSCLNCQRSKVTRHIISPTGNFNGPSGRYRHVHIDIIGPLAHSHGYTYCLTAIDRFTRWPEAWPITSITAEEVGETFVAGWISRFGVPNIMTTDQGRQFESAFFSRLMNLCAKKRIRTTGYHPCANGMVERMHRQLKAALMCHSNTWTKVLPLVLLGMRSTLKEDIKTSAAELVYGEPLRLPGELIAPQKFTNNPADVMDYVADLKRKMEILRLISASHHTRPSTFIFKDLAPTTHVFLRDDAVRRPLQPPYTGPHAVLQRRDKTLTLDVNGRKVTVSIDRVKPPYIENNKSGKQTTTPATPATANTPPPIVQRTRNNTVTPSDTRVVKTRSGRCVRFRNILDI